LPPDLKFELVEPLRELFKDEVRAVRPRHGHGDELLDRQPFPGPGLGVRILGEVTAERVALLQQADLRVQEEMRKLPNFKSIWQSFAVLLPVKSVGVMGDQRTYENVCALRVVDSIDAMTADWTRVPYDTLAVSPTASSTRSAASTAWSSTSARSRPPRSNGNDLRRNGKARPRRARTGFFYFSISPNAKSSK
jgi:GMP synthase (glutamine-hydrolysing) B subunit